MNKSNIERAFYNNFVCGNGTYVLGLEGMAYELYGEIFTLYFLYIGKEGPTWMNYIDKVGEIAHKNHTASFLEALQKNEDELWVHVLKADITNDTVVIGKDFYTLLASSSNDIRTGVVIYCKDDSVAKRLIQYLAPYEPNVKKSFNYITAYSGGFGHTSFDLPEGIKVPLENYLEDFPYIQLKEFCEAENPGIFLFYGEPGCGKSYMVRKLIQDCNTEFFVLDASILNNITQASFIDYLTDECRNCVLILEDCEKLLVDRNLEYNPFIGTILNLTDGLLGDGLKLKFICTFNTNISNIDPAVLRKGRLVGKYEFKKLPVAKANALCDRLNLPKIDREATLAEIYNASENDFSKKTTKKIGF